jgi:hypothetical protein
LTPFTPGDPPGPNVVKEFIDRAQAEGLRIVTYYWHMAEKSLEAPHSEWICKNRDGTPIEGKRGVHLDQAVGFRMHGVATQTLGADSRQGLAPNLPKLLPIARGSTVESAWLLA